MHSEDLWSVSILKLLCCTNTVKVMQSYELKLLLQDMKVLKLRLTDESSALQRAQSEPRRFHCERSLPLSADITLMLN